MIRVRNLPYAALMLLLAACRFAICWIYLLIFALFLYSFWTEIRQPSAHFALSEAGLIAYLTFITFTSGAAWWVVLRNLRSQRTWVIAVSIGYLLTAALLIVKQPSIVHSLDQWSFFSSIGVIGPLAYLPPHRLRLSMKMLSVRLGNRDQTLKELRISL